VRAMRRIGEVAAATGLKVRTLHHYDEIGLLAPSGRTEAGYRLYSDDDVRRLYRIVALRRLGLALGEIAALLEDDGHGGATGDPRALIRAQLERLDAEAVARGALRARLTRLLRAVESADGAAPELFLEAIEGMTMVERYYTPEQLKTLERRRQELGDDAIRHAEGSGRS
jgi:DNA-binding transcriptional MerR regulator